MYFMWDALTSFFLSSVLSANVAATPDVTPLNPPVVEIAVQPLAIVVDEAIPEPVIDARAALVIETHSNEALYAKNVWDPYPIASLTKLMTALVVREKLDLDQEITISKNAAQTGGSRMGLIAGEKLLVRDLLHGLLISSGNDAAVALSEAVAQDQDSFVNLMNERTAVLGLSNTQFVDPTGLADGNISSAFEVAHLAKQVFQDPFLQNIMRQREALLESTDGNFQHQLTNTNRLLGTDIADRIIAGKTGTTNSAGQCLISFFKSQSDRTVMTILLGSPDMYSEVKKLIGWADASFSWE